MSAKTIAKLAFVCLGVLALMDAVMLLASLFSTLALAPLPEGYNRPLMISASAIPFLILTILSIYLISSSNALSMKHFSEGQPTDEVLPDVQRLAFTCLGIYVLISSIPGICSFIASIASLLKRTEDVDVYTKIRLGGYVGQVIQFGIGTYLIMSVSGWRLFKRTAIDKVTSSEPQTLCPNCGNPLSLQDYNLDAKEKLCSICGHSLPESLFV